MFPRAERKQFDLKRAKSAVDGIFLASEAKCTGLDVSEARQSIYIGFALMLIREHVALAPYTTLGVGGPARFLAEATSEAEVMEAVEFARSRQLPLFVLGGGSNLAVADAGFPGFVLKIGIAGVSQVNASDETVIYEAGAGEDWDAFVARAVGENCAGLECLSGIPGTVGGTPVQNVGAYGQEVSQRLREVRVLDLQTLQVRTLSNAECGFAYRSSIFNTTERNRYIILNVAFELRKSGKPTLGYADLQIFFAQHVGDPTLAEVRAAVREIRHRKAMLIVPGDEDARSVGSFFKNPVVAQSVFEELSARLKTRGLQVPSYPASNGFRKLPAAWLVEQAGFAKGYNRGPAGISRRHALAIVNRGGATAADIMALKDEIQSGVAAAFGIGLQPEPVFVGF
jgi:UDP-N-acetylmuramate dehydrogenase